MISPKSWLRALGFKLESPPLVAACGRLCNPPSADFTWNSVRAILVIKLDDFGDFALATPFLRELRRTAPQARITLVVKPSVRSLAETCPYVDAVFVFDPKTAGLSGWKFRRQWRALRLARRLRSSRFDVAVLPRWDVDHYHGTQLAVYAGARAIVAYSEKSTAERMLRNPGYDRMVSHVIPPDRNPTLHEAQASLALISEFSGTIASTKLELWFTEADLAFAREQLPDGSDYVAIITGAAYHPRRWPVEHFAQLCTWLKTTHNLTPVVIGAADDPAPAGVTSFLGRTTPRQAAALLARCRLFVGNDTGLMHFAAAGHVPVVEISAFRIGGNANHTNSPARFHPWGVPYRVVQPPAGRDELAVEEISLSAVKSAVDDLLSEVQRLRAPSRAPS